MKKARKIWFGLDASLRRAMILAVSLILVATLYKPVWAQINRIVGGNVAAGDGLTLTADDPDTMDVLPGWGLHIDNDSVEVWLTGMWADSLWDWIYAMIESTDAIIDSAVGAERAGDVDTTGTMIAGALADRVTLTTDQTISGKKNFTDTLGLGEPGTDGLMRMYSEQGGTDYIMVWKPHATMTQDVTYLWPANDGDANQYLKSDGSGNLSWDTPGGAGDMLKATYDIDENDTVDAAEDVDTTGTQIAAALANRASASSIHDTVWTFDQFWGGADLAIKQGVGSSIGIYYPLSSDSNSYFVRHVHESGGADQVDTVVFAGYLPMGIDGNHVDSITYNIRTTGDGNASSVQVKVYKRDADDIGALALCDSMGIDSTSSGAWEHRTTGSLDVAAADAGDVIEIQFIVILDADELLEHDKPKVWYTGR